jgi:hypothetical protein
VSDARVKVPTFEEIELRAYDIYLKRGDGDGVALEDSLAAERELLASRQPDAVGPLVKRAPHPDVRRAGFVDKHATIRRLLLLAATHMNATPHPRCEHRRAIFRTSCNAMSPDCRTARRSGTRPGTNASVQRLIVRFLPPACL